MGRTAALFFLPLLVACADDPRHEDPFLEQVAANFVELTGLDHEAIIVNPAEIVALRTPREHGRVLPHGAACAVLTADGKHIAVLETCLVVRQRLDAVK